MFNRNYNQFSNNKIPNYKSLNYNCDDLNRNNYKFSPNSNFSFDNLSTSYSNYNNNYLINSNCCPCDCHRLCNCLCQCQNELSECNNVNCNLMEQLNTLQECYKKLCEDYAKMKNENSNHMNQFGKNNDEKDNYKRCLEMLNQNFELLNQISNGIPNLNDKIKGDVNYYIDKPFEYKHLIDKYSNRVNNLHDLEKNIISKYQQPNNLNNNISNLGNNIQNNQTYDPCAKYISKNIINTNQNYSPSVNNIPNNNNSNQNYVPSVNNIPNNNINSNQNFDPSVNIIPKNNINYNQNFVSSINIIPKNNINSNQNYDQSANYISKINPNIQKNTNIEQNKKPGIYTSKSFGKPLPSGIKLNDIINPRFNSNDNEILNNQNLSKPEIPQYIKDDIKRDLLNPLYKPQGPLQKSDFINSKYNIPKNNLNNSDKLLISQIPKQNNFENNEIKNKKPLQIKTFSNEKINLSDNDYGINNKGKILNNNKNDNIRENNFQKETNESFSKKGKNLKRIKSYENMPNFTDGNCWACNLGCSVSTTGYSTMNFSPYDPNIKRREVTPIKEGTIYEQYTRHKRSKSNKLIVD